MSDRLTRYEERTEIETQLNQSFEKLKETQAGAIRRIVQRLPEKLQISDGYRILDSYFGIHYVTSHAPFGVDLIATDKISKYLPLGHCFHLTSDLAAESLSHGKSLFSPLLHNKENVTTHRGIGLHAAYALLTALGIPEYGPGFETSMGYKNLFLFASKMGELDPEQWVYENRIGGWGQQNDQRICDLLYIGKTGGQPGELHPALSEILKLLKKGQKPSGENFRRYVSSLILCLNEMQGLRYRWIERLQDVLQGKMQTDPSKISDPMSLLLGLDILFNRKGYHISRSSRAVVLEFDPRKALKNRSLLILPLDDRDPKGTAMLPEIPKSSIVRVFSEQKADAHGLPWAPIEELGPDCWIKRVTPNKINVSNMNPATAMCGIKYGPYPNYQGDTIRLWKEPLKSGDVVSALGLHAHASTTESYLFAILKQILIDTCSNNENLPGGVSESIISETGFPGLVYTLFDEYDKRRYRLDLKCAGN